MKKRTFKFAPLSGGFMAASLLGILVSIMFVYNHYPDWGITFTAIFVVMLISSFVSMTVTDPEEFIELETRHKKKK